MVIMSVKKRITFLLCVAVLLSVVIFPAFAQEKGLVQCGMLGQAFCDTCDIFVLAQTVLKKLWNPFAIVIAAAMMLYGGFLMLLPSLGGGSAAMHTRGVKVLTNALIGLTIVFFAWIAVDTILKVVAGGMNNLADPTPAVIFSSEMGPWNEIECKRGPKREPIALLQIPEEFRCKADGAPAIGGFDPCEASVSSSLQSYWINDQATSFTGVPVRQVQIGDIGAVCEPDQYGRGYTWCASELRAGSFYCGVGRQYECRKQCGCGRTWANHAWYGTNP